MRNVRRIVAIFLMSLPAVAQGPAAKPASAQAAVPPHQSLKADEVLNSIPFRLIGPASPAGRVWHITGVPQQPKIFYLCTADGGVWKSTNFGATVEPIFNDQPAASCGPIAVAPSDPNVVWVGTGEPASTRANSIGRGVFKSTDAGKTWQHMGLDDSEETTAIVIDPRNPRTVYVAALGHLWGPNAERGIFKTTDGGKTWTNALVVDDRTGFSDLVMDPKNPDTLYAAAWQRMRWGDGDMTESGPGSGIFKTTDAGAHWTRLSEGLPEQGTMAKITLAVAPNHTQIVYAAILTGEPGGSIGGAGGSRTIMTGGVFRTDDGGGHWSRVNPMMTNYYYDRIVADPKDDSRVWMPIFELMRSDDGGKTWAKHNMKHVHDDLHALWIDPHDPSNMALGGDGGLNVSLDGGEKWIQSVLPIAQFYEVDVDNQEPYWVYGGMQDTGHWAGPSRTYDNEGITNYDWIKLRFNGDGMAVHPDPRDPNVIYMVNEFGNFSRLDLHYWARTELQPKESDNPEWAKLHKFRWDWTPPMMLSANDPDTVYFGANYVFKCRVAEASNRLYDATTSNDEFVLLAKPGYALKRCDVISSDLTRQQEHEKLSGAKDSYHSYGALFSLAQSPKDPNVLWAGSDDGWIHVTKDGGKSWTRVDQNICAVQSPKDKMCPVEWAVVSRIEPSNTAPGVAYVALDRHTLDDKRPYVFATADYGQTWRNITGNLPEFGPAYIVREDPHEPALLFVGTEFGLYVSFMGGSSWTRWESNLPMSAVRSMVIQPRDRELVVGTFGRAIWIADIAALEQAGEANGKPAFLFQPKDAVAYNIRYTYGATIEELNGDLFFRAENPPYGTTIYYTLRDPIPGGVLINISNPKNKVIRRIQAPGTPGLHAIQWDLESDAAKAAKPAVDPVTGDPVETLSEQQAKRRVEPGKYMVTLYAGAGILTRKLEVKPENPSGVKFVLPRK
jgi:photosystem II stability/assembly factor-like uncharacterized protein